MSVTQAVTSYSNGGYTMGCMFQGISALVLETVVLVFKPGFEDKYNCFNCTNILTSIHSTTKLFVPFCSVQDGKSTDVNGSMF